MTTKKLTPVISQTSLMMKRNFLIGLVAITIYSGQLVGQEKFPNTLTYSDSIGSPAADLGAISWIQGAWRGEAFGGVTEEIWSAPLGGSMMCTFKLVVDDKVQFYEIETITEENNSLILRLKHFHSDLKGWEKKDITVDFKLVKVIDHKVFFDGYTFEKISEDEMNVFVVIDMDGKKTETKFNYHK